MQVCHFLVCGTGTMSYFVCDAPVLMHSGNIKMMRDIKRGDKLAGGGVVDCKIYSEVIGATWSVFGFGGQSVGLAGVAQRTFMKHGAVDVGRYVWSQLCEAGNIDMIRNTEPGERVVQLVFYLDENLNTHCTPTIVIEVNDERREYASFCAPYYGLEVDAYGNLTREMVAADSGYKYGVVEFDDLDED